jgi:hypothetical protein
MMTSYDIRRTGDSPDGLETGAIIGIFSGLPAMPADARDDTLPATWHFVGIESNIQE